MLIGLSLFFFIAIVKAPIVETEVQVYVAPNPVGIGSSIMIEVNIDPDPQGPLGYEDVLITVTWPDTTTQSVLGPFNTDQFGLVRALFVPPQVGSYLVEVSYPETFFDENNFTSGESTTSFVVQSEAVLAPTAIFKFVPHFPEVDEIISFSAAQSFDSSSNIVSYLWDFGDGSGTQSGMNVTHSYTLEGTCIVELTVTNEDGVSDQVQQIVTVYPKAITPLISSFTYSPLEPVVNEPITFDASATNGDDFNSVTYSWSFGDPSNVELWHYGVNTTYTYHSEGNYVITLTVTTDQGIPDEVQKIITVNPKTLIPPEASFTFSPLDSAENKTILFNSSSCIDNDGTIVTYRWDFGDNSTSTDQNPIHTYLQSGIYSITLTITDDDGLTDSVTANVNENIIGDQNNDSIPEFSSLIILPLSLIIIITVIILQKRLRRQQFANK